MFQNGPRQVAKMFLVFVIYGSKGDRVIEMAASSKLTCSAALNGTIKCHTNRAWKQCLSHPKIAVQRERISIIRSDWSMELGASCGAVECSRALSLCQFSSSAF